MTPKALFNLQQEFRSIVTNLRVARDSHAVDNPGSSTRPLSIAITECESVALWARRALEEIEWVSDEKFPVDISDDSPREIIQQCYTAIDKTIPKVKAEHTAGGRDKWYRMALAQMYVHLVNAKNRIKSMTDITVV